MRLHFDSLTPTYLFWMVIAALSTALLFVAAVGIKDRWRSLGRRPWVRATTFTLTGLVALLLALAAFNPTLQHYDSLAGIHIAVVLDVSESVLNGGEWQDARERAAQLIEANVAALDSEVKSRSRATIVTFRTGATATDVGGLDELAQRMRQLDERDFAAGDGTDIASGLERAETQIRKYGGRGVALLISDGNQTAGDALTAAHTLAQVGVAVHVIPLAGQGAELFIESADLPRQVHADVQTYLRAVLRNQRNIEASASLVWWQNGSESTGAVPTSKTASLKPASPNMLPYPLRFDGVGIQFADLAFRPVDVVGGEQRRRFFTHVVRPLRIVGVGDARWRAAISTDVALVDIVTPEDFSVARDLKNADAVVIADVAAHQFAPGELGALAKAVQEDGVGLMLINGGHIGREEDQATVLMSYQGTPVEPLLPVSVTPRPFTPEPPPRQIIIMIDASGSMAGWPLEKAKQIAATLIERHLRPVDRLDVLVFTTNALHLVKDMAMNTSNQAAATAAISGLGANGGTDPNEALSLIADRKYANCGLFFISDLGFNTVTSRPECAATIFAIGHSDTPQNSPLLEYADPIPAPEWFDPTSVQIRFFEPEPRDKFFEPGDYRPLPAGYGREQLDLPVPSLELAGNAIAYAREDADLVAVRPRFTDPVLAYRSADAGYVAAFTSELAGPWLETDDGRAAVQAWITRLVAYAERDRYDFHLVDRGREIDLTVMLLSKERVIPDVDALEATLVMEDVTEGVAMTRDPAIAGVFSGVVRTERMDNAAQATLVLREVGPDALPRPQRIPFTLPPAAAVSGVLPAESYSFGVAETLLRAIAGAGGGRYDPTTDSRLLAGPRPATPATPLWPWLFAAAATAYLAAIAVQRLEP